MGRKKRSPESVPKIGIGSIPPGSNLKAEVYLRLRELIVTGRLSKGTMISAHGIAGEIGKISRTPVKAAMDMLAEEGLLHWVGYVGAVVPGITRDELYELLTLRFGLETKVVHVLGALKNERILGTLRDLLKQLVDLAEEAERDVLKKRTFHGLDMDFHRTMAELAGMPTAAKWITNAMHRFILHEHFPEGFTKVVINEHNKIFRSITLFDESTAATKRDSFARCGLAVRDHIRQTAQRWNVDVLEKIDRTWETWPKPGKG